eukprot:8689179-Heterocapsa_arctica.AAC.1
MEPMTTYEPLILAPEIEGRLHDASHNDLLAGPCARHAAADCLHYGQSNLRAADPRARAVADRLNARAALGREHLRVDLGKIIGKWAWAVNELNCATAA